MHRESGRQTLGDGLSTLPPIRKQRQTATPIPREWERRALANRHRPLNVDWLLRNRALFSADPSNPYSMSWLDETPAEEYFGFGGLECVLLRNVNGCWEGFVCVPQYFWIAHPTFAETVGRLRVHGGVTRVAKEDGFLVLGFDTSHLEGGEELQTGEPDFFPCSLRFQSRPTRREKYRTLAYCRRQLEQLAEQILAYGAVSRTARLIQRQDWRWCCGAALFPGATIDARGRLVLDLTARIGTADVLALLRDFAVGRQRSKRSSTPIWDAALAETLDRLLDEFPRDDYGDFPDDIGPCLQNLPRLAEGFDEEDHSFSSEVCKEPSSESLGRSTSYSDFETIYSALSERLLASPLPTASE